MDTFTRNNSVDCHQSKALVDQYLSIARRRALQDQRTERNATNCAGFTPYKIAAVALVVAAMYVGHAVLLHVL